MAFNKNELILDKVRSMTYSDLATGKLIMRMTSLEDVTLNCSAEGEDVTDAVGAIITTIYRAKKATISGSNSLISLDLAAIQYGTEKKIASDTNKIPVKNFEVLEVSGGKITLAHKASEAIKYIYSLTNKEIATTYEVGAAVSATAFTTADATVDGKEVTEITVPTGVTGKIYVEYVYESEEAVMIKNSASNFPEAGSIVVYAYFKDVCNENLVYSGRIIAPKAKINPESIELTLNSTGKHPFEFSIQKDYCAEEGDDELFSIIVTND